MNNYYFKYVIMLFVAVLSVKALAINPVAVGAGISDPHIRVFNDTVYLYSGHDNTPDDKTWVMKDWRIFATTDLCNWEHVGTISPKDNFMGEKSKDCWAGDAAQRNGKYYFYFSDRIRGIGVMQSDRPEGGFKDVLGDYLVAPDHDPTIFVDDDDTPYMIYGYKETSYKIVKLNDDMISLAEEPKSIVIEGEEWADEPVWMDKNYLFKHNDMYYLSWGGEYAISDNIYGPYECVGAVGEGYCLGNLAHGSFFNWKGQFYHIWCYYIRPNYRYRESIMTYCHMDDNGLIVTDIDFLDRHYEYGVGRYNASWDRIEAEWFYDKSDGVQKKGTKEQGFHLSNIQDGDYVCFSNVEFDQKFRYFSARVIESEGDGVIEIREGAPTGKILAKVKVEGANVGTTFSCGINSGVGVKDIYLVYKADANSKLQIDWINFSL